MSGVSGTDESVIELVGRKHLFSVVKELPAGRNWESLEILKVGNVELVWIGATVSRLLDLYDDIAVGSEVVDCTEVMIL